MPSMTKQFDRLRAQIREQSTPRALAGLAILVLIVAYIVFSDMSSTVSEMKSQVEEMQRERRLQLSLLNDNSWIEQSEDFQARLGAARQDFWTGSTPGIVAAQLQGAVENAAREANLQNVRINVEPNPSPMGNRAFTFEIAVSARDTSGQFLAFFQILSRTDNQLTIEQFEWRRLNGTMRMRILAPAILENPAEEPAA